MKELSLSIKLRSGEILTARIIEPEHPSRYVLFLHGGSKTIGKDRFIQWQKDLGSEGIGTIAFDYIGVGESAGDMSKESLSKRTSDTIEVVQWMCERYSGSVYTLCGVSMGGYIVLDVIERMPQSTFDSVILMVPAAYSDAAYDLKFDETFSLELRRPGGWADSSSFKWLKDFSGTKLLIASEYDQVIPQEIIDKYRTAGDNGGLFYFSQISGAPHNIFSAQEDSERIIADAYRAVKNFLFSGATLLENQG